MKDDMRRILFPSKAGDSYHTKFDLKIQAIFHIKQIFFNCFGQILSKYH
jgi:hypothetical protein